MRSSIACVRCRRSKVKCVNSGVDTTCRACEASGRECSYPIPVAGHGQATASALRDASAGSTAGAGASKGEASAAHATTGTNGSANEKNATGMKREHHADDATETSDAPKRSRPRKSGAAKDAAKTTSLEDALDTSLLKDAKTWESLFELFQVHYSTLLPFLHPTTFLTELRASCGASGKHAANDRAAKEGPSPLVLLGVLTLVARFDSQLINHHASNASKSDAPLAASDFYASALRSRLSLLENPNSQPELDQVQGLLMLSLHDWGMGRGKDAWMYIGMAIRHAQALALVFELEWDSSCASQPMPNKTALTGLPPFRKELKDQTTDDVISLEAKRRTFWSCFLVERYMSNGKYRPRMIKVKKLGVQLPSDNAFAFGERVKTSMLGEVGRGRNPLLHKVQIPSLRATIGGFDGVGFDQRNWMSPGRVSTHSGEDDGIDRWEIGSEEGVLSRLIRIVKIWGSVTKRTCIRSEQISPWDPGSKIYQQRACLEEFQSSLPRNLTFTTRNTETHVNYKHHLAPYTLMHVTYFLCIMLVHRPDHAFIPIRSREPDGPRSDPLYFPVRPNAPDGYYRESAKRLWGAARDIVDLCWLCHERGVLMENPIIGFAIYSAGIMGVYTLSFPYMDTEGSMCGVRNGSGQLDHTHTRRTFQMLLSMQPRLKMATGWAQTLMRMHWYYVRAKKELTRPRPGMYLDDGRDGSMMRRLSIQESTIRTNAEDLKLFEDTLAAVGTIEDEDEEMADADGGEGGSSSAADPTWTGVNQLVAAAQAAADSQNNQPDQRAEPNSRPWGPAMHAHPPLMYSSTSTPPNGLGIATSSNGHAFGTSQLPSSAQLHSSSGHSGSGPDYPGPIALPPLLPAAYNNNSGHGQYNSPAAENSTKGTAVTTPSSAQAGDYDYHNHNHSHPHHQYPPYSHGPPHDQQQHHPQYQPGGYLATTTGPPTALSTPGSATYPNQPPSHPSTKPPSPQNQYPPGQANASPPPQVPVGGPDDIIAFIAGCSHDRWAEETRIGEQGGVSSFAGVGIPSGWLLDVWKGWGVARKEQSR